MPVIDRIINSSNDDGYGYKFNNIDNYSTNSSAYKIGSYYDNNYAEYCLYRGWLRFTNITIPKNSIINSAYIKVCSVTNTNTTSFIICAENISNPQYPSNLTDLESKINNSTSWKICTFDSMMYAGNYYNSSDIKSTIQDIINRTDWVSGNAIQLLYLPYSSNGISMNVASFDESNGVYATSLHIDYTLPNNPPTTPSQFYNPASATTIKAGQTIALSWASSSDSDSNLSGYYIYKNLNSGSFSYLATANTNQYTTTIPTGGYSTIQYRVVAYDTAGASSGNCDSAIITINNNSEPTVVVRDSSNNIINNNQIISLTNENDFMFSFTPNDINTTDTLQYNISLGAVVLVPYTPCTKNVVVSYIVLFADLVRGNNVITLNIKDSNNAITTVTFTLKNKVTDALSFRTVLQILQSLSYTNTSCTCLNDLKPSGYNKTVLSMSDIISSI